MSLVTKTVIKTNDQRSYIYLLLQLDTTDARSTTILEPSTVDYYGRTLRRALDRKISKLRLLFCDDEDITTELDRVVCRLMKLALKTSSESQCPPPAVWMQYKLLDLLTLTEKAIERRRQHMLDRYSLKAIEYCKEASEQDVILTLNKIKEDETAENIMSKYLHLVPSLDYLNDINKTDFQEPNYQFDDSDFDYVTSNEFEVNSDSVTRETDDSLQDGFENNINASSNWESPTDLPDLINSDETNYNIINIRNNYNAKNNKRFKHKMDIKHMNASLKVTIASQNKVLSKSLFKRKRIENINSSSNTKLVKKVYKKLDYYNHFKYSQMVYNQNKIKERKKIKYFHMLQAVVPKPIPGNLLALCYPNIEVDKNVELSEFAILPVTPVIPIKVRDSNVASTEICVFISLVTEFGEETIALQRNIGTDPDADMIFFENEVLLESVTNVTNDDSFCYIKAKLDTEKVESQSIFLYDINEPSTSKGVRHLSTDVQCGPDVSITNVMLSASTSFTKVPKCQSAKVSFTKMLKGIKIGDSLTDIHIIHNRTYDFGTSTVNSESVTFIKKTVGIKVKDSDMCIGKYECSTMTSDKGNNDVHTVTPITNISETKSPKLTNALQTEESGSNVFEKSNVPKSLTRFVNVSQNKNDFQNQLAGHHNVAQVPERKYVKPVLSYGGIHIHSYKDRLVCEDLVYQGQWQRSKTKALAKKYPNEHLVKKNKKLLFREVAKTDIKKNMHGPISVRNPKVDLEKRFSNNIKTKSSIPLKSTVIMKNNKNEVKVASKKATSSSVSNNIKSTFGDRKQVSASTPIRTNNNIEKPRSNIKKYIPLYLRKKRKLSMMCEQIKEKNNHNKNRENTDLQSLNMKVLSKDLLKISNAPHTNINYLVFRNEINTNKSDGKQSPPTELIRNSSIGGIYSPVSQHSSNCSSPNSEATVCAASTRTKVISNRKNATSTDRSKVIEAKHLKNKKQTRRLNINKKHPNTIALNDKENLPESSRNTACTKDNEKKSKVFVNRTKSVYMAQITDSLNLGSVPVISKSKMHLNQPIKSLATESPNIEEMLAKSVSEISIKKPYDENTFDKVIQKPKIPEIDDLSISSQSRTESTNNRNSLNNIEKSAHQTKSSIISAIRQLVEDKLNVVETNDSDGHLSDSETIILSREEYNMSFDDSLSSINSNNVPTNKDIYSFESGRDNTLIKNPDIVKEIDGMYASANMPLPDVDQDCLSLSSIASVSTSKFSEYYSVDNELDNNLFSFSEALNMSSLEDIFERKDTNIMPNAGGLLTTQAFSGFSMNLEPNAAGQSDLINLIDSETGSVTLDSARQTASEELFVSVRSSDTYESCLYNDEADVPNWLFNIISQSVEESEAEDTLPVMVSVTDQDYEVNGTTEPSVGVGAGAGDGRGIHSDHSQGSSGRGTSLSSSAISSGIQSEVISVDSSALITHSVDDSVPVTNTQNETTGISVHLTAANRNEGSNRLNGVARGPENPALLTSDVDADVSSLDTDVVDSDN